MRIVSQNQLVRDFRSALKFPVLEMRLFSILLSLLFIGPAAAQTSCRDLGQWVIDQRCTEDKPICVYRNGGQVVGGNRGHHCALCINSQQPNGYWQVDLDEGCDFDARVCVGRRPLAANVEGTACAVCVNSIPTTIDANDIDDGCPPEAPICVNDDGSEPALRKPGTKCIADCFDTSNFELDIGCPDNYPHCVYEDGSEPGYPRAGDKCSISSPSVCDDGNPCTDDICDPYYGCYYVDNGSCVCDANAVDWQCNDPWPFCSGTQFCICDVDTEGAPFCWPDTSCEGLVDCSSNADCPEGTRCASTCCGEGQCLPECDDIWLEEVRVDGQPSGPTTAGTQN
ncbi:hypothetical protein FisN_18Hu008 [Fistulifera solaris]|uniref:EGF-like domain-containing protein n=1 Tax=Fistulifera solaris TaxID=1519565 RepID=A0A1Z5JVK3_FISSO|nr:hypothetical protein FisN_18Hu008 [Fistulifera solaris]|eukprot:GAX17808.1 hypothetical protein FisN_18Hu008 [Fistulifera solaris]